MFPRMRSSLLEAKLCSPRPPPPMQAWADDAEPRARADHEIYI